MTFNSRNLKEGMVGNDVKFYQKFLNDIAGQGLLLDGHYGSRTTQAVKNYQSFFTMLDPSKPLVVDGELGPKTQGHLIEIALQV